LSLQDRQAALPVNQSLHLFYYTLCPEEYRVGNIVAQLKIMYLNHGSASDGVPMIGFPKRIKWDALCTSTGCSDDTDIITLNPGKKLNKRRNFLN